MRRKTIDEELQVEPLPQPSSGYKRPSMYDGVVPLICNTCGANVGEPQAELHTTWHEGNQ